MVDGVDGEDACVLHIELLEEGESDGNLCEKRGKRREEEDGV